MYVTFHDDCTFSFYFFSVLEVGIGYEFQQIVHIGYFKSDFHVYFGLFQRRQAADRTVGCKRQVVYQQFGIVQCDCIEVVG